jgi:5-aminolevulinate synthase
LALDAAQIPHLDNPSHIVPVMVGDPVLCRHITGPAARRVPNLCAADQLPDRAARHRAAAPDPSPLHSEADIDHLLRALATIWSERDLRQAA